MIVTLLIGLVADLVFESAASMRRSFDTEIERLISEIRSLPGVARTETMVVLSTHTERVQLALNPGDAEAAPAGKRSRRNGERSAHLRRA